MRAGESWPPPGSQCVPCRGKLTTSRQSVRARESWPPLGSQETGTVFEMCWRRWRVMEKVCYWRHAPGAIAFANPSFFCFLILKIRLFMLFYVWVLCLHICLRTTYVLGSRRGQGWSWATMWGLWKSKKHSATELSFHTSLLFPYTSFWLPFFSPWAGASVIAGRRLVLRAWTAIFHMCLHTSLFHFRLYFLSPIHSIFFIICHTKLHSLSIN